MKNGWTGGQYSVFRAVLGVYLVVRFARLVPWGAEVFSNRGVLPDGSASPLLHAFPNLLAVFDSPAFVTALLSIAVLLSACLAIGAADRIAAVALWYISACLFGRNPLISNPSLPFIGWLLLAHACLPPAPFGSWRARGRIDPDGGWRFPGAIFAAAWIVMSLGYTYGGVTKLISPSWINGSALSHVLSNPLARPTFLREGVLRLPEWLLAVATWSALALELAFTPMALFQRLRPPAWLLMVTMHVSLLVLVDFAELSFGMLLLHFFTFDPAWIRAKSPGLVETVYFDGHCGLCHASVRFALAEDRAVEPAFRFAPLSGATFEQSISISQRANLPDSIVVQTADGRLLIRAAAILHIMARMGGLWRVLASVARWVPHGLLNVAYDGIARVRRVVFAPPSGTCPIVSPVLRERLLP